MRKRQTFEGIFCASLALFAVQVASAQILDQNRAKNDLLQASGVVGPFNVEFPVGGDEYDVALNGNWRIGGSSDWTMSTWFEARDLGATPVLLGGVGDEGAAIYLLMAQGRAGFWNGRKVESVAFAMAPGWHQVIAVGRKGIVTLYLDGSERLKSEMLKGSTLDAVRSVGFNGIKQELGDVVTPMSPTKLRIAPRGFAGFEPFGGRVAGFMMLQRALTQAEVRASAAARPKFDLITFDTGSPQWPVQAQNMTGLTRPQEPWTLPTAKTPPQKPVAIAPYAGPELVPESANRWRLAKWQLSAANEVNSDGAALSRPGKAPGNWSSATVPGTVLTTLVDRGVYPDPAYGLNNMAIPDAIGRQDWWYRTEFELPADIASQQTLTFKGINYIADIWLNGALLGTVKGAFNRGQFDVTGRLSTGANALAVRIHPPIHPGTPHEQSITGGWGPNGGLQALDGPTFFASEGWDWIPGVRDRNIGIWQDVVLSGSDAMTIGDPQIVTTLPKADNSVAEVEIDVPVRNSAQAPVSTEVSARFDGIFVKRSISAPPGETVVRFTKAEYPQLSVANPKLWWPNGYGDPNLHTAHIAVTSNGRDSDLRDVRFGMRQLSYELSLMNPAGKLRRVEVNFTQARALGQQVVDPRHEGIRKVVGGWVNSLTPAGDASPAVTELADARLTPFLILKVNGVRVPVRGGAWGTDDFMKRISRERLEPYFRLHREANVNLIRNWMGQNTEPVFYDLADEYGMLVVNDFWASTQDYQMEPEDPALFLANAEDTIKRYRNHPSIAVWFGRNEGVPPRLINQGLERLTRTLDGTRWYTGSSNSVNLWFSGPYNYQKPETYFTTHAKGFAVEVGSMSFPTLEAFQAAVAPSEQWPITDSWAYHDWHQNGNGDTHGFVEEMTKNLGAATSLADFERKAQLMNYDDYRAIMEGMNAQLWSKTSGRMLWMTQPAWPSTMWQILSHDYDTHASFYAFKHAGEAVHVQMTLPDHKLQVVNNRRDALNAKVSAHVFALDGRSLRKTNYDLSVAAGQVADGPLFALADDLQREGGLLVALDATDAAGTALSHNVYWVANDQAGWRKIAAMTPQRVTISATATAPAGSDAHVSVILVNRGTAPALNTKLTLLASDGSRILPAYYADNYVSLLPGETRTIDIAYPTRAGKGARVTARGWNVVATGASIR